MGHQRNVKKDRKWLRQTLARYEKLPKNVEPDEGEVARGREILRGLGPIRAKAMIARVAPKVFGNRNLDGFVPVGKGSRFKVR